jgi:DNA invertase Pin-like site-specific DNA recombinase
VPSPTKPMSVWGIPQFDVSPVTGSHVKIGWSDDLLTHRDPGLRVQPDTLCTEGAMAGQRIGYIRVSGLDQNTERQLEGVELDRIFTDKASGKDIKRPQLEELLRFIRDGDTLLVHSMDRLARNLDDLRSLVQRLTKKGVRVEFLKEHLVFTGEDSPLANLMLSVMGAFAEFERALIGERQREGITLAKARGAYRGRGKALSPERAGELRKRAGAGEQKTGLAREFGISRETVYQYLKADS